MYILIDYTCKLTKYRMEEKLTSRDLDFVRVDCIFEVLFKGHGTF